jgi:hypothetical protein
VAKKHGRGGEETRHGWEDNGRAKSEEKIIMRKEAKAEVPVTVVRQEREKRETKGGLDNL